MIIELLTALYRANPFRPHCNAETRTHTFLCRLIEPHIGPECDFPAPPK